MKKLAPIFILILISTGTGLVAGEEADFSLRPEVYFRFEVEDRSDLLAVTRVVSIDKVIGDTVYAYANQREFDEFRLMVKDIEILTPSSLRYKPRMMDSAEKSKSWDAYPTYTAYREMMYRFQTDFPDICRIDSIGHSVNNRAILFAVISDNVRQKEAEPEVMYTSSMHGDELTGYVLMLRLIDYLLSNYQTDKRITGLVNNLEIWINPLSNPDGAYFLSDTSVYGATRCNANGVDLNRNFPSPAEGEHPDGRLWQPETVAMMELAERQNFVLSANFHGGAEVLNYPWDCWQRVHADNDWLIWLCRQYADTAQSRSPSGYLTDLNNGITNGWSWYPTFGNRQDYMTYFQNGREITIEISAVKMPLSSTLPHYWAYNRDALINFLGAVQQGIHGQIRSGDFSNIRIGIVNHERDNSRVVPDADFGDYYRLCLPGNYRLEISDGASAIVLENVNVDKGMTSVANAVIGDQIPGDIDANGKINATDLVLLKNFILNRLTPNSTEFQSADWNNDGAINNADMELMRAFLMNLGP